MPSFSFSALGGLGCSFGLSNSRQFPCWLFLVCLGLSLLSFRFLLFVLGCFCLFSRRRGLFPFLFFRILMGKSKYIHKKKKSTQRPAPRYTRSTQGPQRGARKKEKGNKYNYTHQPHLQHNQFKKSTKKLGLSTIYKFFQDHKLQTKEDFILYIENSSLSKAILFLSNQIVQKMHKWAAIQAFLRLFPTKAPCQERRVSLTDLRKTQLTPTMAKKISQNTLAFGQ